MLNYFWGGYIMKKHQQEEIQKNTFTQYLKDKLEVAWSSGSYLEQGRGWMQSSNPLGFLRFQTKLMWSRSPLPAKWNFACLLSVNAAHENELQALFKVPSCHGSRASG